MRSYLSIIYQMTIIKSEHSFYRLHTLSYRFYFRFHLLPLWLSVLQKLHLSNNTGQYPALNNINKIIIAYLETLSTRIAVLFFLCLSREWETAYSTIAKKIMITQTVIHMSMKEMYETLGTSDRTPSNIAIKVNNEVKFIPTRAEIIVLGIEI